MDFVRIAARLVAQCSVAGSFRTMKDRETTYDEAKSYFGKTALEKVGDVLENEYFEMDESERSSIDLEYPQDEGWSALAPKGEYYADEDGELQFTSPFTGNVYTWEDSRRSIEDDEGGEWSRII